MMTRLIVAAWLGLAVAVALAAPYDVGVVGLVNQKGDLLKVRVTVDGTEAIFQLVSHDKEGNAVFRVMSGRLDFDDDVQLVIKARALATR